MLFSQVRGQRQLISKIKSLINNNHFPHAVLFTGKDGYGNLALALSTAQYISCTNKEDKEDSCNACASCSKYMKLIHPDLHFIFPSTTTDKIDKNNDASMFMGEFRQFVLNTNAYCSLNQWYDFYGAGNKQGAINVRDANNIISSLTLKTYESNFKIMIIWNVDKMNQEASDKILKILEEPYPNTFFILTTEHKDKIIPTILSRVQQIAVPPLDNDTMTKEVRKYNPNFTDEQVKERVALCEGDYNRIAEIDGEKEIKLRTDFVEINRYAMQYNKSAKNISAFVDVFSKNTREQLKLFLTYCSKTIEKCYLYNNNVPCIAHPLSQMDDKFKANYPKFITDNNIEGIYKVLEQAQKNIDRNANAKINLFDMIIKLGMQLERR